MSGYELGRTQMETLRDWYSIRVAERNEATTRLHLINCLLMNCLKWTPDDVIAEESHGGDYSDYTISTTRRALIVEAKKEGEYFDLPAGDERLERSIPALCRDYPKLKDAILQVCHYCQSRGVPLAAVTNGHQLVAFVAIRTDGVPPLDGRALVFPSLETMVKRFLDIWQKT